MQAVNQPGQWGGSGAALVCLLLATTLLTACGDEQLTATAVSVNFTVTAEVSLANIKPDPRRIQLHLDEAWNNYKVRFVQEDGRVMDPQMNFLTTSEGQAYSLLRAVWKNDLDTFKKVLRWSQDNLQVRRVDKLFSYKWGQAEDGTYRVLDKSAATDADVDIALALIFAAQRWNDEAYRRQASELLNSIWTKTVVTIQGKPYLTAGDWAATQEKPTLNPSYLAPYAFRIFARFDPAHDWVGLVDSSYEVIRGCSEAELGGLSGSKLPPNWCGIDKTTSRLGAAAEYPRLNGDYGYDAFRTMWRVALDYRWFGEKRALDYLTWSTTLRDRWKENRRLAAYYDHSGKPLETREDLATYAGALSNFALTEPALAEVLVSTKIVPLYRKLPAAEAKSSFAGWGDAQNYYNQNWVWFGLALYIDALPNLTAGPVASPSR